MTKGAYFKLSIHLAGQGAKVRLAEGVARRDVNARAVVRRLVLGVDRHLRNPCSDRMRTIVSGRGGWPLHTAQIVGTDQPDRQFLPADLCILKPFHPLLAHLKAHCGTWSVSMTVIVVGHRDIIHPAALAGLTSVLTALDMPKRQDGKLAKHAASVLCILCDGCYHDSPHASGAPCARPMYTSH